MLQELEDERIIRVADILEQVSNLNKMIDFHEDQSKDVSMRSQYEFMRSQFLDELKEILAEFKIELAA